MYHLPPPPPSSPPPLLSSSAAAVTSLSFPNLCAHRSRTRPTDRGGDSFNDMKKEEREGHGSARFCLGLPLSVADRASLSVHLLVHFFASIGLENGLKHGLNKIFMSSTSHKCLLIIMKLDTNLALTVFKSMSKCGTIGVGG